MRAGLTTPPTALTPCSFRNANPILLECQQKMTSRIIDTCPALDKTLGQGDGREDRREPVLVRRRTSGGPWSDFSFPRKGIEMNSPELALSSIGPFTSDTLKQRCALPALPVRLSPSNSSIREDN